MKWAFALLVGVSLTLSACAAVVPDGNVYLPPVVEAEAVAPADGEFIGYLTGLDEKEGVVSFDEVEWLSSDADAQRLANMGLNTKNTPSLNNGFYIYNPDVTASAVPLAADAEFFLLEWSGTGMEHMRHGIAAFAQNANKYGAYVTPYRLVVRDGVVVSITEQYIP